MNPNPKKENLKPYQPGQSGNPKGKPKGIKNRATTARKMLELVAIFPNEAFEKLRTIYPKIPKTMTAEDMMVIVQISNAITKGDTQAFKAIMDCAYGSPTTTIANDPDNPIETQVIVIGGKKIKF